MKKTKKFVLNLSVSIISIGVFWWLESGFALRNGDELIKSIIFAIVLFMVLIDVFKQLILWVSFSLFGIMIILYLFWQIPLSNMFGSIGFGILLIFILSYLPGLIKKGYIEKL